MGSKSTPSPPPAPDPAATAAAQAAANRESAIATQELAMVNQDTPYGALEYTPRGESAEGNPQYTATTTLAPAQQDILDLQNQASIQYGETGNQQLGAVSDKLAVPLDYGKFGPTPQASPEVRQQMTDNIMSRLQPDIDRDRELFESNLMNQGIELGSNAYSRADENFQRGVNDARVSADMQAGNEMARIYGLEQAARNAAINEEIQQRQVPLNELSALFSGSQVQGPQFVGTPSANIAPADIMGATYASYGGDMDAYRADLANRNANTQGLYGLLGSGAMGAGMFFGR